MTSVFIDGEALSLIAVDEGRRWLVTGLGDLRVSPDPLDSSGDPYEAGDDPTSEPANNLTNQGQPPARPTATYLGVLDREDDTWAQLPKLMPKLTMPTGYPCFVCGATIAAIVDSVTIWHYDHSRFDQFWVTCATAHYQCLDVVRQAADRVGV